MIAAIDAMVSEDFKGRVLTLDSAAARAFAGIFADRRAAGRLINLPDCPIAAIARSGGAALTTWKFGDFEGCGVEVIIR